MQVGCNLVPKDYDYLADLFHRTKTMVAVCKTAMEVSFGIDIFKSIKTEENRLFLAKAADRLVKAAEENKRHLINIAYDYTKHNRTENNDRAFELAELARKVLREL